MSQGVFATRASCLRSLGSEYQVNSNVHSLVELTDAEEGHTLLAADRGDLLDHSTRSGFTHDLHRLASDSDQTKEVDVLFSDQNLAERLILKEEGRTICWRMSSSLSDSNSPESS